MKLANKVAIITGAGSGIGRESAILFTKEGAKIVVADINDAGYFAGDSKEIALSNECSEEAVLSVLKQIQEFDPLGVGSRSLNCAIFPK